MVLLLAVVILQFFISWLYLHKRSMKEEKGKLLYLILSCSLSVLFIEALIPKHDSSLLLFYSGTLSVCVLNLSAIYLRLVLVEQRTSGYLIFLACSPMVLLMVFLILYLSYQNQILESSVYYYLDLLFLKAKNLILLVVLAYELILLASFRKKWACCFSALDGQVGLMFVLLKLSLVLLVLGNSLLKGQEAIVEFPVLSTALLFFFGTYYQLYFNKIHLSIIRYRKYIFRRENRAIGLPRLSVVRSHKFYLNLCDKWMQEKYLFRMKNFHIRDLANMLNLNVAELQEILLEGLDMSFDDYLNMFRLRYFMENCSELDGSGASILRLAGEAGFSSKYKFYRTFKKHYRMNPKQYLAKTIYSVS